MNLKQILAELVSESGAAASPLGRAAFDSTGAEKRLLELFKVGSLDAFGSFSRAETGAMGAIVEYLEITQKGKLPLLRPPVRELAHGTMQIDAATRRNLELTHSLSGGRDGSLLSVIDRTATSGGGRLLERRLSSPSCNLNEIHARLDGVTFFKEHTRLASDLREALRKVPDIDRALSRLGLDRGGPRDITAIRSGIGAAADISGMLSGQELPEKLGHAEKDLLGMISYRNCWKKRLWPSHLCWRVTADSLRQGTMLN